jgi:hypothetical protein
MKSQELIKLLNSLPAIEKDVKIDSVFSSERVPFKQKIDFITYVKNALEKAINNGYSTLTPQEMTAITKYKKEYARQHN